MPKPNAYLYKAGEQWKLCATHSLTKPITLDDRKGAMRIAWCLGWKVTRKKEWDS